MMPLYHKDTNPHTHTASFFFGKATIASTNPQDVDAMSPSRASLYYLRSSSNDSWGNSTTSISRNASRVILHLFLRAIVTHGYVALFLSFLLLPKNVQLDRYRYVFGTTRPWNNTILQLNCGLVCTN